MKIQVLFNKVDKIYNRLVNVFLPVHCVCCNKYQESGYDICDDCLKDFKVKTGPICLLCGREKGDCVCSTQKYNFLRVISPYNYTDKTAKAILGFKYQRRYRLASFFAKSMAEFVKKEYGDVSFDYITYIPRSKRKIDKIGYDQTEILAYKLSDYTGIKCKRLLKNVKGSVFQHSLTRSERSKNVKGMFKLCVNPKVIKGKNILLCDDITTTGATLNEASKLLHKFGAEDIFCVTAESTQYYKC